MLTVPHSAKSNRRFTIGAPPLNSVKKNCYCILHNCLIDIFRHILNASSFLFGVALNIIGNLPGAMHNTSRGHPSDSRLQNMLSFEKGVLVCSYLTYTIAECFHFQELCLRNIKAHTKTRVTWSALNDMRRLKGKKVCCSTGCCQRYSRGFIAKSAACTEGLLLKMYII